MRFVFPAFLLFLLPALSGQSPDFHAIDSLLRASNEMDNFNGSVVIGTRDSILYEQQFGLANRCWDIPVSSDTRFDIASVNKSFIAGMIMLAVEQGKLSLDDHLPDLLAQYTYEGTFHSDITIHQMLSHTSGLPDYDAVPDPFRENGFAAFKRMHFTNPEYVNFISQLPPIATPGERFYYSNFAYHLLAIILEDIYQLAFPDLLQSMISKPLQLDHTCSSVNNEEIIPLLAEGYQYDEKEARWLRNNFIDLTLGRRIFSTAKDLFRWGGAMCDDRLFPEDARRKMLSNHLAPISGNFSYGYGWVVFDSDSAYSMGNLEIPFPYIIHGGATEGYRSMLVVVDGGRYIFSMLGNTGSRIDEMNLTKQIIHLLIDAEHDN